MPAGFVAQWPAGAPALQERPVLYRVGGPLAGPPLTPPCVRATYTAVQEK